MTQITFSKNNATGRYEATVTGFEGVLQVDRQKSGAINIYAKTSGGKETLLYYKVSATTLVKMNFTSAVTLRIECETQVTLAQYEAE